MNKGTKAVIKTLGHYALWSGSGVGVVHFFGFKGLFVALLAVMVVGACWLSYKEAMDDE